MDKTLCMTDCYIDSGTYMNNTNASKLICSPCNATMQNCVNCSSNQHCTLCKSPLYLSVSSSSCIELCSYEKSF